MTHDTIRTGRPAAAQRSAISYTLNGEPVSCEVDARTLLVHHLREERNLTGTHIGCDTSQCGACAVHLDGRAVKSCTVLAVQVDGREVTTIEAVRGQGPDDLHPVQEALQSKHGLQCGFCTPGMVMTALELLDTDQALTPEQVQHGLVGNICRCTGYQNIVDALVELSASESGGTR
ncbi:MULTISPECIES: (2Fe-2S)-binding protein [Nocardioides]|uniref:(2Fe-2S)-binding protein n=1 Tax=Nocardioides vastitatis TaxID=2568655 RepID=A0ABW0ZMQ3_9ACTN|nr:(2Fe-2S)-binding protein [Nocardioides sp.]THJ16050.1 (2Fe-2S)-binding protein [Nocardioides sp.]